MVHWQWPRFTPQIRKLLVLMAPAALGAGVIHVNQVIDVILASTLPTGSVSYLYYADRINQLPLGVIGVAIGTALLPLLSRQLERGERKGAIDTQNRALEFGLLVTVPAATALHLIAGPVIEVLFERGAFTPTMTAATAAALKIFALGLPAFVMIKIFQPGFFARLDTRTPVWIAAAAVVLNLVVALALMPAYLHIGIAAASVFSSWFSAITLAIFLYRRQALQIDRRLLLRLPRIALAAAGMGLALHLLTDPDGAVISVAPGADSSIGGLIALVVAGIASYGLLAWLLGAFRVDELRAALRRPSLPAADKSD
jgi:putative peptidoglycan lipid II flippase